MLTLCFVFKSLKAKELAIAIVLFSSIDYIYWKNDYIYSQYLGNAGMLPATQGLGLEDSKPQKKESVPHLYVHKLLFWNLAKGAWFWMIMHVMMVQNHASSDLRVRITEYNNDRH